MFRRQRTLRYPEPLEPRLLLATFFVTNTNNSGAGSLRAAIADANADAVFDTIEFQIPGAGPHIISPERTNPADPLSVAMPISTPMLIDGYSQPGASPNTESVGNNANIRIRLDGALAGAGVGGIFIDGAGATVKGLAISNFEDGVIIRGGGGGNIIAGNFIGLDTLGQPLGNRGYGVTIEGSPGNTIGGTDPAARNVISNNEDIGVRLVRSGSVDNVIQGNYIGTNPDGTLDRGNLGPGIEINEFSTFGFASRTTIGGLEAGAGNLISGNNGNGVAIVGAGAQFNSVLGNRIGVNAGGTAAIPNSFHGVLITFSSGNAASNNTIGGVTPAARNIISGNMRAGVAMFGVATANVVQGNYIGTNAAGDYAIPNGNDGVRLGDASLGAGPSGNFIGGTAPGAGNLISGNIDNGIEIVGATTTGNFVEGNLIGPDGSGMNSLLDALGDPRGNDRGILIDRAPGNRIGGASLAARNVISGNFQVGIRIDGATATDNIVQGNRIGAAKDGLSPLPNGGAGVLILDAASRNVIGSPWESNDALAGNVISHNGNDGVAVLGGIRNTIRLNTIRDNAQLGIDLDGEEETLNDEDDEDSGPNNKQNWPELLQIDLSGPAVIGFLETTPSTVYKLDFYANLGSSSMVGEGQLYLGTLFTTSGLDGGSIDFEFPLPTPLPTGWFLTATATDSLGNTSEFSHDADMDGLYDNWELGVKIDGNNDGAGDFELKSANPLHKDLFVEVDAMAGRDPTLTTLGWVVASFASAPNNLVNNPDGLDGVTLHAELDETTLTLQGFPFGFLNFIGVKSAHFGTILERGNANADDLLAAKRKAYRYCIFADSHGFSTSSGLAELGGNDLMVTHGLWGVPGGTPEQQAGTFMHELGHTLGLFHGGDQELFSNHKPNYYSVMNYLWTTPKSDYGPDLLPSSHPNYRPHGLLDFSRGALPTLNENNLNETTGIGGPVDIRVPIGLAIDRRLADMNGPVDWSHGDANGDLVDDNDVGVAIDVNGEGPVLTTLRGFEDWSHLVYAFRHNLWFEEGAVYEPDPDHPEWTFEQEQQLHEDLLESFSADFDRDADVDGADFLTWQRGLSRPHATLADGDADYDEDVDSADLYVWRQKFGPVVAPAARPSASAVAPTPAASLRDREGLVDAAMAVAFASPAAAPRRGVALRNSAATEILLPVQLERHWSGQAIERLSAPSRMEAHHRGADAEKQQRHDDFKVILRQDLFDV